MELEVYKWTKKDKWLYILSMVPFVVVFVGTAYLLATYSIYLLIVFVALYIITNIFQAGCCVGCIWGTVFRVFYTRIVNLIRNFLK